MNSIPPLKTEPRNQARPPIVVIMGHIDHGKTTILDWYRKSAVAASESGGITQHVGAYEVEYQGKEITFIDTPGHEAFSGIRSRGARVADIAIIVVAADESIKPQTREALAIAQANELPFIIAINKTDKPEANPERVKQDLTKENILVESYGGKVPSVEISAKTGENMDELLDTILLVAELEELRADPSAPARGVIIETHRDSRRGITATLLVRDGTLKRKDIIVIGTSVETIRILENFLGKAADSIGPSQPGRTAGISKVPSVGDMFRSFSSKTEAQKYLQTAEQSPQPSLETQQRAEPVAGGTPVFNIIIKADVTGSREALEDSIRKMGIEEITVRTLRSEIGNINEDDVKLALATRQVTIIGFKVKIDASARELVEKSGIPLLMGDVIYRLLDDIRARIIDAIPPIIQRKDLGTLKVLKFFKKEGPRQIIGGRVESGIIAKNAFAEIRRNREVIGKGTVLHVQREKHDVQEAAEGSECGIMIMSDITIREGDVLETYIDEQIKRTI